MRLGVLLMIFALVFSQMSLSAGALSQAQKDVLNKGIYYFNVDAGSSVCSGLTDLSAAQAGATNSPASLDSIAQKYSLQSAIVEQVGGGVVASYQADQPPSTPASTMKLIIVDTLLRSGLNLNKTVSIPASIEYNDGKGNLEYIGSSITLSDAMDKTLRQSGNTSANVLMYALGGEQSEAKSVAAFTQKAQAYGYTNTIVKGYYSALNDGKNTSTISDEVAAMDHIFTASGSGYSQAQQDLIFAAGPYDSGQKTGDNYYDVTDDANKWAGTSRVAGNVAKVNIGGQDYIIGLYINSAVAQAKLDPQNPIKEASADIVKLVAAQKSGPNNGDNSIPTSGTSNTDYAGRIILNQGQLQALEANIPIYQQAAQQAGIPWQVLAAVHYRETNFSRNAADAGPDGQYQVVSKNYPYTGMLTEDQFLQESIDAANFIKSDGAGLDTQVDTAIIKDALVKYNGEPQKYIDQAVALGYTDKQGYEGSPYVMNIADKPRDPTNGPLSNWLQSFGSDYRPATAGQYGAYVVYASISGQTLGGECPASNCDGVNSTQGLSPIRQTVVCEAQAELAKWDSHQLEPGSGYLTYSQNHQEDWCADFISWLYEQAGYPLAPDPDWRVSAVKTIKDIGQQDQNFHWHLANGYTPKPGDIAIHYDGSTYFHTNLVVGVSGSQINLIGGNQSSNDFNQSKVSKDIGGSSIVGYVSPD